MSYHKTLQVRRGYKKSIVAVAHKMMRIIFHMLKEKTPYRDPGVDYEELLARRNAPRWIAALNKYGLAELVATRS
jgi:hypothetical protein